MNNACKVQEYETKEIGQPTLKDILAKLNRLELENKCLKADNQELTKERDNWKEGFELLHNMIENEESISFENGKLIVSNPSLEDLNLTDSFLNKTEDCGYDPDKMEEAYLEAEKNCKFSN
jgi:uncharacterized protein (UPF0335 family)